jgi:hypothetical protein
MLSTQKKKFSLRSNLELLSLSLSLSLSLFLRFKPGILVLERRFEHPLE